MPTPSNTNVIRDRRVAEALRSVFRGNPLAELRTIGNPDILQRPTLALLCSTRCPGSVILQTFDLAQALRESGRTIVGGFHTPMEREGLELLLRGPAPLVICPARSLERFRLPASWRPAQESGRLLVISPFDPKERRATADLAERRNAFVAILADEVLVTYAAPGSRTEAFARELVASGKRLLTLAGPQSTSLVALGAEPRAISSFRTQGRSDSHESPRPSVARLPLFDDDAAG